MRILSLSTCPLDPSLGSGKTRLRWSEGLRSLGHRVEMIEPKDFETWHGQRRGLRFRQAWGAWGFVKDKLKSGEYDLIEFFGGEFGLATWQLSKMPHRPLIVAHTDGLEMLASQREREYNPPISVKGHLRSTLFGSTHHRLSRAAFDHADAFVAGCEIDREFVLRQGLYPFERTAVVEPGLDKEYLAVPLTGSREDRIAFMGSWIPRKGIAILSEVMTRVLTAEPMVYLDLYGSGAPPEVVLSSFPTPLHNRITVYPRLTSQPIADGFARAKVFFFPTQYEGFGMALSEAMACGCAPVTTPTGFGATLRDGEEALICDFTDTEAMERAVLSLLHNNELRARIARNAWERVRGLTWEANIARLEAVYTRWSAEHIASRTTVGVSTGSALAAGQVSR